jgi:hypothetical protein
MQDSLASQSFLPDHHSVATATRCHYSFALAGTWAIAVTRTAASLTPASSIRGLNLEQ